VAWFRRSERYGLLESDRGLDGKGYLSLHCMLTIEPSYVVCREHKLKSQTKEKESEHPVLDDTTDSGSDTASEEDEVPATSAPKPSATVTVGLGSLDRAQMERERLKRLKRGAKKENIAEPPSKRIKIESVSSKPATSSEAMGKSSLQYPDGTIKWTYAVGYPVESHHINIEEVLQKDTLKAAVLSGFQVYITRCFLT